MKEIWEDIPGYDGIYELSSLGRVRSWNKRGTNKGRSKSPKILKPKQYAAGYLYVNLSKNNVVKVGKIHRLIARVFHGPAPKGKPFALHRDDVKTNNTPQNIYWGSQKDNMRDRMLNGNGSEGENNGLAKLTKKDVLEIRDRYKNESIYQYELAEEYGVTQGKISQIVLRKNWTHI